MTTKRTTVKNYDADLIDAKAEALEMLLQMGSSLYPSPHNPTGFDDQFDKSLDDALNNEWKRGIRIERWAELALGSLGALDNARHRWSA